MLRKLLIFLLLLCMLLPVAAFATEDEEDVSIADVLGVEDAATTAPDAAVPDSQAEAPVDPAAPVDLPAEPDTPAPPTSGTTPDPAPPITLPSDPAPTPDPAPQPAP